MEYSTGDMKNSLIIIDCFDDSLSKTFSLPQLEINETKKKLFCPIITMMNGCKVSDLSDILRITKQMPPNPTVLTIGFSYINQYEINIYK